jgi:hypothetical protein
MKKFYDFLKQVFLGETGGLGSKTANMTVDQLIKVGTDMNVSIADAEKMINGFITKSEDKVLADITSSLADTKKLMSSDDMIEQELRIEYIDGKGADTMSFDEFKLSKQLTPEDLIGPEGFPPAVTSDKHPVFESLKVPSREQKMAIDVQADIDKVAKATGLSPDEARAAIVEKMNEGYEIGNPKRRGAKDLAHLQAYLQTNLNYSPTNAAIFMEDIEEIAFSGAIDLASDTAKNVSKQEAKQIGETLVDFDDANLQKAFDRVDNTPDEVLRKEQGPMTLEGTFKDISPEHRAVMEEMYAPLIQEKKIFEATQSEIQQTSAKIQDLVEQGRFEEAERLAESLKDFQKQLEIDDGIKAAIIPPDRTLNAMGGIIQGVKNRGK